MLNGLTNEEYCKHDIMDGLLFEFHQKIRERVGLGTRFLDENPSTKVFWQLVDWNTNIGFFRSDYPNIDRLI